MMILSSRLLDVSTFATSVEGGFMSTNFKFLWLDCIFEQETINKYKSHSPATNKWQAEIIDALVLAGNNVKNVGFIVDQVWPLGNFFVSSQDQKTLRPEESITLGYLNVPFVRLCIQTIYLVFVAVRLMKSQNFRPDYFVVFSCLTKRWKGSPSVWAVKVLSSIFRIPWVCVVGDGEEPNGASGYIFCPWSNYLNSARKNQIHLDGGIYKTQLPFNCDTGKNTTFDKVVFMYVGALTEHGGVKLLVDAFKLVSSSNAELWICGRGEDTELVSAIEADPRIKFFGYLDDYALEVEAWKADVFVNPRPTNFGPNLLNFPSKILFYLSFGKPIISTKSAGLSPDYHSVLTIIKDTELSETLERFSNYSAMELNQLGEISKDFSQKRTWDYQVDRLMEWLTKITK